MQSQYLWLQLDIHVYRLYCLIGITREQWTLEGYYVCEFWTFLALVYLIADVTTERNNCSGQMFVTFPCLKFSIWMNYGYFYSVTCMFMQASGCEMEWTEYEMKRKTQNLFQLYKVCNIFPLFCSKPLSRITKDL